MFYKRIVMFFTLPLPLLIGHRSKLELPSPNANNYLHIDPRYLSALLMTPSPSDVTMGSPSPVEIAASVDVPDAVVLRKNLQNAAGNGGGLDEIREQFVSVISNNADNGNVKHISRVAYPGQAKQIIASATGVARIVDEVGALDEAMTRSQPGPSSEDGRRSTVDDAAGKASIGQREVSDLRSRTEIIDVDLGLNDDHEIIVKFSSSSNELASGEDRRLTMDSITRDKEASSLRSKAEIVDVDLGSSEITKVQPGQSSSGETVPRECSRSTIKSAVKGKTEIGQKEALDLRSKMEIADVDLDSNNDRESTTKVQPSESSSGELRLGECCWPTREGAANDEARDKKVISEKKIIGVELGLDDKNALKERRRSMVEAIKHDEVNSDQSRFSRIGSEKSSKSMVKSVVDVSDKEIVNVEFTDVVKVQPVHSSHGILTLKDDRRLMIEKLTNELKIKLEEEKNKSKGNLQVDKVGKDDAEQTELSVKSNVKIDMGIDSRKKAADFKSDRIKYLDAKAIASSLNVSMTSLDGRHECALSDFSVDKEDYRLSQYGSDEDEEEYKKPVYTARLNLTKYADGQIEDVTNNIADSVNDHESSIRKSDQSYSGQLSIGATVSESQKKESFTTEMIDNRVKSSEGTDQMKYIVEESLTVADVGDKDNNLEVRERIEEIFKMSRETGRTEKGSELDAHSSDKRMTSCDSSLEIDGKYLKSIVNSRKSPRKIRDDRDVEVKEQYRFTDDSQALQSEAFQSSSTKMKSFERVKEEQIYNVDVDIDEKGRIKDRRSRAEKVFQDSSKSSSTKTRSPRKVEQLQTDESEREMKDHDKSISDRETPRSRKGSQKSLKTSKSAKSPKKKGHIFYTSEDMKNYDRAVNDRVITQLEEVFLDSSKKPSKTESPKKDSESELKKQSRHADNRETSRTEEPSQHPSRTSSTKSLKKTQTQKAVKMSDNKEQQAQEAIKTTKDADNKTKCDFNEIKDVYTRKVRRYNVPLQGSLDSMIVSEETSAQKPKKDDAFSKKSKSYESIKRIQEVFLGVPPTKANSSDSQLDIPDEFCSICCYMNEITFRTEEEVSSPNQETFYTLRSTCSSLADDDDDDSIECDICGSLNLQESADDLDGKIQEIPCELCKICGEVDGSYDQDSALPADRYTYKMIEPHHDDDDSFEIENCGFQSGTESADDRSRISDKEKVTDLGRPKSQTLFIHGSSMNRDQPRELYFIPKDEIAILTSGARKVNRKGSLFRKKEDSGGRDKRRYSSVDSLQLAKMSAKASDKVLKVAKNTTLIGSADNLQDSRRSKSLQRSADDVDRLNKSTDNLNSQKENLENLEKENDAEDSTQKLNTRDKEEVKMILTQHGIKIISEKETAL